MDPSDLESTRQAVKDVEKILGDKGIDILFNNAGTFFFYGLFVINFYLLILNYRDINS